MTKNRRHRSNAGFTLVELIIASGIIGVALAMAMGSLISVSTAQNTTETDAVAAAHLSSVLEEIRDLSELEDVFTYIPPAMPGLGATEAITFACVDSADTVVALPLAVGVTRPTVPNPMEVQVTITWADKGGRVRAMQASTLHRRL